MGVRVTRESGNGCYSVEVLTKGRIKNGPVKKDLREGGAKGIAELFNRVAISQVALLRSLTDEFFQGGGKSFMVCDGARASSKLDTNGGEITLTMRTVGKLIDSKPIAEVIEGLKAAGLDVLAETGEEANRQLGASMTEWENVSS